MDAARHDWRARRRRTHCLLACVAMVCATLVAYPKLGAALPECPIHEYFGVLCPGCGSTRAVLALLHGHMSAAWRWNALFVCLLPLAVWFGAESYRRAIRAAEFRWPQIPAMAMYGIAAAGLVFAVLRNMA
jgi:hypothetical protein